MKKKFGMKNNDQWYTYNGESKTLPEWAESIGVNYHSFYYRFNKYGLEMALALGKARITKAVIKQTEEKLGKAHQPVDVEPFDPDLELKRRVEGYRAQGLTDKQILVRERAIF